MAELKSGEGELKAVIHVTRKETGLVETYEVTGKVNPFFPPYGLFWTPALEDEDLPEPVVEVIREIAPKVIDDTKKETIAEFKQALKSERIAYRKAYSDALFRVVEMAQQQKEDDEEEEQIAIAIAFLI